MIDPLTGLETGEDWSQLPPPPPLDVYGGGGQDGIIAILEGQATPQQVDGATPNLGTVPVAAPMAAPVDPGALGAPQEPLGGIADVSLQPPPPPPDDFITPAMADLDEAGRQAQVVGSLPSPFGHPGGSIGPAPPPVTQGYLEEHPELADQYPGLAFDVTDPRYSEEAKRDLTASDDPATRELVFEDERQHLARMNPFELADEQMRQGLARENYALEERARVLREDREEAEDIEKMRRAAAERAEADRSAMEAQAVALANDREDTGRWWASRSTGQKILAGLAAAMGGVLSVHHGGKNSALDYFERQVQQDIESQRANLSHRRQLLGMQQGFLRDREANDRQEHLSLESYRLASYKRAIDWVNLKIAQYDPAGTAAMQGELLKRGLIERAEGAAAHAREVAFGKYLDLAKADREASQPGKYGSAGRILIDKRSGQPYFEPNQHGGRGGLGAGGAGQGKTIYPWVTEKPEKGRAVYDPDTGGFLGNTQDTTARQAVEKNMELYTSVNRMRQEYRAMVARLDGTSASYEDQQAVEAARADLMAREGQLLSGASVSEKQDEQISAQYPLPRYKLQGGGLVAMAKGENPLTVIDRKANMVSEVYADQQAARGIRLRDEKGNWQPGTHLAKQGTIRGTPVERSATVQEGFDKMSSHTLDPQSGKRVLRDPTQRLERVDEYLVENSRGGDVTLQIIQPLIETEKAVLGVLREKKNPSKEQKAEIAARQAVLTGLEERREGVAEPIDRENRKERKRDQALQKAMDAVPHR